MKKSKSFWKQMKMITQESKIYQRQKSVLRGKFILMQAYLKKIEKFQINNRTLHLQELEKQQEKQPRASRRKEITKIREELNDVEIKRIVQMINKSRS